MIIDNHLSENAVLNVVVKCNLGVCCENAVLSIVVKCDIGVCSGLLWVSKNAVLSIVVISGFAVQLYVGERTLITDPTSCCFSSLT